jgi:hypothetical protein
MGREPATSPRPPVLAKGAASLVTYNIFIIDITPYDSCCFLTARVAVKERGPRRCPIEPPPETILHHDGGKIKPYYTLRFFSTTIGWVG